MNLTTATTINAKNATLDLSYWSGDFTVRDSDGNSVIVSTGERALLHAPLIQYVRSQRYSDSDYNKPATVAFLTKVIEEATDAMRKLCPELSPSAD
jgi:hypothetical protein